MENHTLTTNELEDKEFDAFRDIVTKESGIKLSNSKKMLVQARLMKRMREIGIKKFADYLEFLQKNYNEEIISLINCITTNKTEFFREKYHFQFLNDIVFPQFEKEKLKKVRIWSAGCSTGEEPYTIAINLLEYFSGKCPFDVKILATDIDTNVLLKGKDGIYSQNPIEEIDANILKNYFYKGTGANSGLFKVKDSLKNLVSFRRLNLLNDIYPMKGKFHMIFCRNVVIYFDRESQKKLFDHFYKYLDDDGYLFVGHSEALTYLSDYFVSVGRSIYKKQ